MLLKRLNWHSTGALKHRKMFYTNITHEAFWASLNGLPRNGLTCTKRNLDLCREWPKVR